MVVVMVMEIVVSHEEREWLHIPQYRVVGHRRVAFDRDSPIIQSSTNKSP